MSIENDLLLGLILITHMLGCVTLVLSFSLSPVLGTWKIKLAHILLLSGIIMDRMLRILGVDIAGIGYFIEGLLFIAYAFFLSHLIHKYVFKRYKREKNEQASTVDN